MPHCYFMRRCCSCKLSLLQLILPAKEENQGTDHNAAAAALACGKIVTIIWARRNGVQTIQKMAKDQKQAKKQQEASRAKRVQEGSRIEN